MNAKSKAIKLDMVIAAIQKQSRSFDTIILDRPHALLLLREIADLEARLKLVTDKIENVMKQFEDMSDGDNRHGWYLELRETLAKLRGEK